MSASTATFATKAAAAPPAVTISAATFSPRPLSRSTTATRAPSAANVLEISAPILRPAPVTMATWLASFMDRSRLEKLVRSRCSLSPLAGGRRSKRLHKPHRNML